VEEEKGGRYTVIGGDFNARTGMEGGGYEIGGVEDNKEEDGRRKKVVKFPRGKRLGNMERMYEGA